MSLQTTVRPATADEGRAIRDVADDVWHAVYDDILGRETVDELLESGYKPDVIEQMVDLDDVGLFVARAEGDTVGYASCGMTDSTGHGDFDVYVHPEYWGEGIGTELFERGKKHLQDVSVSTVRESVLVDNDVGNAFYRKHLDHVGERTTDFAGSSVRVNVYELSL